MSQDHIEELRRELTQAEERYFLLQKRAAEAELRQAHELEQLRMKLDSVQRAARDEHVHQADHAIGNQGHHHAANGGPGHGNAHRKAAARAKPVSLGRSSTRVRSGRVGPTVTRSSAARRSADTWPAAP